jgi:hypothetical protein
LTVIIYYPHSTDFFDEELLFASSMCDQASTLACVFGQLAGAIYLLSNLNLQI